MSINIHVQEDCARVEVVRGEINLGKFQELEVTKDGTYTPDTGIDGFSKVKVRVLPTDMLDGLEDGWDVMFYDENKRGLASYSIRKGNTINPPVYDCKDWQTADGATILFPYTPTEDVIFYALNATYADQLYDFYGVDKGAYPYVFMHYMTQFRQISLIFAKNYRYVSTELKLENGYLGYTPSKSVDFTDPTDLETVLTTCMERITSVSLSETMSQSIVDDSRYYFFSNCDELISGYNNAYHTSLE